jgi:hypothetical protein
MTVANESFRTLQTSDGIQLIYSFDFHIQGQAADWPDQIRVYINGVLTVITYTISLVTENGGTITFVSAPASGIISIVRRKRNTQGNSYPVSQAFPSIAVETSLDDLTLQTQDVEAIGEFGIRQPIWEEKRVMELPDILTRALRVPVFDQDGNVDVSDLVAVPIEVLNCYVNFNAAPYNAVPGEPDSKAAIQAALDSGATYVTGCPGTYNVDGGLNVPNNVEFNIPGVIINGTGAIETNILSFGGLGSAILAENIKLIAKEITGFNAFNIENYFNCSIRDTIIDGLFNGVDIGAGISTGQSDSLSFENVIIRNSPNGGIGSASGADKKMSISFKNVGVELCGFRPVNFGIVSGSWEGGFVRNNTVSSLRGAMEFNPSYDTNGFKLSGVRFDNNGNAGLDALDIFVGACGGLNIENCTFEKTLAANGRIGAIGTSSGTGVTGLSITGNKIIAQPTDNTGFTGILVSGGTANNFIAANTITGLTGSQLGEAVDTTLNYHIVNGVKQ